MNPPEEQQEVYILLLGRTGVGKTATINSFAQILTYLTFDDAINANEPMILSPIRLHQCYEDCTWDDITYMGTHIHSEQLDKVYFSATQEPRIFSIISGNKTFNFIDTPGLCNTGGYEADIQIRKKIYSILTKIPKLHAIVAVVQADDNRLSSRFVGAFNDILTQVPRSAISNLMFLGTWGLDAGSDLDGTLNSYIRDINEKYAVNLTVENNIFKIDNIFMRYLVCHCKSEKFRRHSSAAEMKFIAELSWIHTAKVFHKMTQRWLILPDISDAVTMNNYARTVTYAACKYLWDSGNENQIEMNETATIALRKLAGYLKHNSIIPFSNSFITTLEIKLSTHELDGELDEMDETENKLEKQKNIHSSIDNILSEEDSDCTAFELMTAANDLFKLRDFGEGIENAFNTHSVYFDFSTKNAVRFKAKHPIQDRLYDAFTLPTRKERVSTVSPQDKMDGIYSLLQALWRFETTYFLFTELLIGIFIYYIFAL